MSQSDMTATEHVHHWQDIGPHVERCRCGKRRLKPIPDLYDGVYSNNLKGRWRSHSMMRNLVLVVEGCGSKPGTVAAYAEHDLSVRQDDLPIKTLHANYEGLRGLPDA